MNDELLPDWCGPLATAPPFGYRAHILAGGPGLRAWRRFAADGSHNFVRWYASTAELDVWVAVRLADRLEIGPEQIWHHYVRRAPDPYAWVLFPRIAPACWYLAALDRLPDVVWPEWARGDQT